MTVLTMPWAIEGEEHPAASARAIVAAMFGVPVTVFAAAVQTTLAGGGHGVVGFTDLKVVERGAGANMSVDVNPGRAIIRSGGTSSILQGVYGFLNDATVNLPVDTPHATNARIDLVVAQVLDDNYAEASSEARLFVITGTPSGSPAVPALTAYPNCVVLAQLAIAAASTTVVTANITDKRTWATGLGGVGYYPTTALLPASGVRPGSIAWDAQTASFKQTADGAAWTGLLGASAFALTLLDDADAAAMRATTSAAGGLGKVLQVVNTQTGAVATGTTVMPFDDTIPQNTEGDQYMSLAITPTSATSTLLIDVTGFFSPAGADWVVAALFQDSTAGALAAMPGYMDTNATGLPITFRHKMTSGTTSATTFKVRAGRAAAGTLTFNGTSGARKYGGVQASSITITEIAP